MTATTNPPTPTAMQAETLARAELKLIAGVLRAAAGLADRFAEEHPVGCNCPLCGVGEGQAADVPGTVRAVRWQAERAAEVLDRAAAGRLEPGDDLTHGEQLLYLAEYCELTDAAIGTEGEQAPDFAPLVAREREEFRRSFERLAGTAAGVKS